MIELKRILLAGAFTALLGPGCAAEEGDGEPSDGGDKADDPDGGECTDAKYGDGTCNTDLECAAPDIDCFLVFDAQPEADAWFAAFEALLAAEEFRPPRGLIASSDPRFVEMRALLDRGWEAYQDTHEVGDLAYRSPALVMIDDAEVNAFVAPDLASGKAGFAVMVQTGVFDLEASDQAMLGLVMHELEHALGLHIVEDVKDRLRRFYIARYEEPFGFEQTDDPLAREHAEAWRALAGEVGTFPHAELGGLPLGQSQLGQVFTTVLTSRSQSNPEECAAPLARFDGLTTALLVRVSSLDGSLDLTGLPVATEVAATLNDLRDGCLAGFEQGFVDVVAGMAGASPEDIRAQMSGEDLALVDGVHFIDAVAALGADRRSKMRAAEQSFADASGVPWSAVRYFSYEEAADDATVPVLDAIDLPADGLSDFLFGVLDGDTRAACGDLLDDGQTPPYGADLSDEHHAVCWRVDHVRALAASGKVSNGSVAARRAPTRARRYQLPIPPRLSDLIVN